MFILKKTHLKIANELKKKIEELEKDSELKLLLEKIIERTGIPMPKQNSSLTFDTSNNISWNNIDRLETVDLPEECAVYVDDYFGGKVIRQESTKLLVIDKNGEVTFYYTKQEPDKGKKFKIHFI